MIVKDYKCLFVHIPKVAGQSIESVFLNELGLSWEQRAALLLKPNGDPCKGPPRLAHLTAQEYVELGYLSSQDFNCYFKFSFVRNPWERIWSEYNYRQYPFSFDEFLFNKFPANKDDNYQTYEDLYRHVLPQSEFLFDQGGRCLVNFIGRFETIQSDFSELTNTIFGKPLNLPHKNKSSSRIKSFLKKDKKQSYRDMYSDKGEQFVRSYYAQDIELFGYQF